MRNIAVRANNEFMPKKKPMAELPELSSLPERLAYARKRGGITKRFVAGKAGMDPSQITRYEQGDGVQGIEAATLIKLARALRVPVGWLAADEGQLGPAAIFDDGQDARRKPDRDESAQDKNLLPAHDSEHPAPSGK